MPITTREQLKSHIHSIHDYIRNSGAGYSMTAMKIFIFFYGLKIIEPRLKKLKLDITPFSELVKLAKKKKANEILCKIIDEEKETGILYDLHGIKDFNLKEIIYYRIPEDLREDFYVEIVKLVNQIPTNSNDMIEDSESGDIYDVDVSGKLYEYFIGRDQTAISELGAYFTDRHITSYCIEQANPELEDDDMPLFIDPFGGSGGFTLNFVSYMIRNNDLDAKFWKKNIKNIYHHDMSHDVLKISGLEMFALTHQIPDMKNNFKRTNSFKCEFGGKKFKYIFSNPPYGGNSNKGSMIINDYKKLLAELKQRYYKEDDETNKMSWSKKWAKTQFEDISKKLKQHIGDLETRQVNFHTSSNRIKDFARDYDDSLNDKEQDFKLIKTSTTTCLNDKEAVSLILFMDLLDKDGTCVVVLKEGVFFDNKYANIRKCLIDRYNVYKVVSVPSDQFENTTTKTSILFFKNDGKTKKIEFSELVVDREDVDVYEEVTKDDVTELQLTKAKGKITKVSDKILATATYKELSAPTEVKGKNKYFYSLSYKKYMKDKDIKCSDDYELIRLETLCDYVKSGKDITYKQKDDGIPYYVSGGIKGNYEKIKDQYYTGKHILCARVGAIGNIFVQDNEFYASSNILLIKVKKDIYYQYIYTFLKFINCFNDISNGSVQKLITATQAKDIKIPIPKSKEKLKEWVKKLSTPYDKLQEDRKKLKELEKTVQDEIKRICDDEECEEKKLEDVCEYIKTGKHLDKDERNGGKYPYYGTSKIMNYTDNENYAEGKHILLARKGDLNILFVDGKFHSNDDTIQIKPNKINAMYIYHNLNLQEETIKSNYSGSTVKGIKMTDVKDYTIKIPKNKKLLDKLDKKFKEIEELQESTIKTDSKYKEVLQELKDDAIKNEEDTDEEDTDEETESKTLDKKKIKKKKSKDKVENV